MNLNKFTHWALIIGGLQLGLVVLGFGIESWLLPRGVSDLVYSVIGLSALYQLFGKKA